MCGGGGGGGRESDIWAFRSNLQPETGFRCTLTFVVYTAQYFSGADPYQLPPFLGIVRLIKMTQKPRKGYFRDFNLKHFLHSMVLDLSRILHLQHLLFWKLVTDYPRSLCLLFLGVLIYNVTSVLQNSEYLREPMRIFRLYYCKFCLLCLCFDLVFQQISS